MKRFLTIAVTIIFLLTGSALAQESFIDGTGTEIAYGQDCRRIVSLMPNLTEIVAFLGYSDRLVGKSVFCNYPDSILHADDIGGQVDASLEKIVALQPDIVLAYQGNSLELVEQLRTLDIQVCALMEATTVEQIGEQTETVDRILRGQSSDNRMTLHRWENRLRATTLWDKVDSFPYGESVFFGYPGELVYTAGTDSFINDVIERCELTNAVDIPDRWPAVSAEYILALDPDWILTSTSCTEEEDPAEKRDEMLAELRADPVWSELRAVRNGQLIVVNSDHLLRPGPRILEAISAIMDQLTQPVPEAVVN